LSNTAQEELDTLKRTLALAISNSQGDSAFSQALRRMEEILPDWRVILSGDPTDKHVSELELPRYVIFALENRWPDLTAKQLLVLPDTDILRTRMLGKKAVEAVKEWRERWRLQNSAP
jgi:hypothetical protein